MIELILLIIAAWSIIGLVLFGNNWYPEKLLYPIVIVLAGPLIWFTLIAAIWYVKLVEKYWK